MAHTFLSDEWLAAVSGLREELNLPEGPDVTINLTVTDAPEGDRDLHLTKGAFASGHVDAPTKMTLPYSVARQMFVEGNQQAGMQAFMTGQIKIEGDMTKVMQLQNSDTANTPELAERIKGLTAE